MATGKIVYVTHINIIPYHTMGKMCYIITHITQLSFYLAIQPGIRDQRKADYEFFEIPANHGISLLSLADHYVRTEFISFRLTDSVQ